MINQIRSKYFQVKIIAAFEIENAYYALSTLCGRKGEVHTFHSFMIDSFYLKLLNL